MDTSIFPTLLYTQSNEETVHWHLQDHLVAEFTGSESESDPGSDPENREFKIIEIDRAEPAEISVEKHSDTFQPKHFPVYKSDNGAVAVPSGLIYVRVTTDKSVESIAEQFLEQGFEISYKQSIPILQLLSRVLASLPT